MKSPSQRKKNIIGIGSGNPAIILIDKSALFFYNAYFWALIQGMSPTCPPAILAGRNKFIYDIDAASPECKNYFLHVPVL
jgi:hypothetical protein